MTSGLNLKNAAASQSNFIRLVRDEKLKKELGEEGYLLEVKPGSISIKAPTSAGIFYGIQSLRQLVNNSNAYLINAVNIKDKPRFAWRAFMLDEGRYFKGSAVVKRPLDEMALLKMNTFHWHLTDDQGWRIEIQKYLSTGCFAGSDQPVSFPGDSYRRRLSCRKAPQDDRLE